MSLFVRVDDFPGTKPREFNKHNLENFKLFDSYMKKYDISYVLGVIPYHTSLSDLRWLGDQRNITVAIHGISHDENKQDEFEGLEEHRISSLLSLMKERCQVPLGKEIIDYIPPHNVLNVDTIHALSFCKFQNVHGGPETDDSLIEYVKNNEDKLKLKFIKSNPPLEYGRSDELFERGSVEYLRSESKKRDVWLTLHWPWEMNIGFSHLDNYLSKLYE